MSGPRGWYRRDASATGRAAISRSGPTARLARSGPTISAAKSRCSGCSFQAGACTLLTWPKHRAIWSCKSARSALDPEQLLDTEVERRGELDREQGRGNED